MTLQDVEPLSSEGKYWRDRCFEAQTEAETTRERYEQLNALLMGADDWPALGIPPQHERLLRVLYKRPVATKEMLYHALYWDRPDCDLPSEKIIDVQICKLRQRLPQAGVETVWGRGYRLSDEGRAWLEARIEQAQPARAQPARSA